MKGAGDPRALREMIREASRDEVPDLAWDRIESRIFAELDGVDGRPVADDQATAQAPSASAAERDVSHAVESPPRISFLPTVPECAEILVPGEAARTPRSLRSAMSSRWARVAVAVAVAAAVCGLWVSREHVAPPEQPLIVAEPVDVEKIPFAPGMGGQTRDLSYLKPGDVVEAAVGPVAFGELGAVEWTLSAGSRLTVRDGEHTVELESGSMRGAVAAGTSAQLVIAAAQTEIVSVAAGSVFSVTRSSRKVVVHLETGSATVGPRSAGLSGVPAVGAALPPGARYLQAPMLASFSLDGGSIFEVIADAASLDPLAQRQRSSLAAAPAPFPAAPPGPVAVEPSEPGRTREPAAGPERAPVKLASPAASVVASAAPAAPSGSAAPVAAVMSTSALRSTVIGCLSKVRDEKQKSAADGVRIQVVSTLSVSVKDDGSVKSAVFSPPLAPELMSCAVFLLRSQLEPGARVVSVPVDLR